MDASHLAAIGLPSLRHKTVELEIKSKASSAGVPPSSAVPSPVAPKPVGEQAAKPAAKLPTPAAQKTAPEKATQYKAEVGKAALTEPVFLTDTFLFQLDDCQLLEAAPLVVDALAEGRVKLQVVLSRTVFHPQGGGQPADNGTLSASGLPDLAISFVSLRKEDGAVLHDAEASQADADAWTQAIGKAKVACKVDEARRLLAAKVHSAGHLLDVAVQASGLKWLPGKGYHFPDGPYVEYILNEDSRKIDMKKAAEKDAVVAEIQANIDRLVNEDGPVTVEYKDGMRRVGMGSEDCPCGGTHVAKMSQIGKVEIKKLAAKQGNMRISYIVAGA